MLVPLTIGKLIDFFSTGAVSHLHKVSTTLNYQEVFLGLSFPVAATMLALTFCVGAACNAGELYELACRLRIGADEAGRAIIMKLSGLRIIARIRYVSYFILVRGCQLKRPGIKHTCLLYGKNQNLRIAQQEISFLASVSTLESLESRSLATCLMG